MRVLFSALTLTGLLAVGGHAVAASTSDLEKRVKELEATVAKLSKRTPVLDCTTKTVHAAPSNNFTVEIKPPEGGYKLVGGSCGFQDWQPGDDSRLLQVGPYVKPDGKPSDWYCYAKIPRATGFYVTATFCRV